MLMILSGNNRLGCTSMNSRWLSINLMENCFIVVNTILLVISIYQQLIQQDSCMRFTTHISIIRHWLSMDHKDRERDI
jgi:hypothetical protein